MTGTSATVPVNFHEPDFGEHEEIIDDAQDYCEDEWHDVQEPGSS